MPVRELRANADLEVTVSWRTVERIAQGLGVIGEGEKRNRTWTLPKRQNDITTKRQRDSVPNPDVKPATEQSDTLPGSCRDVVLSLSPDSVVKQTDITTNRQNDNVATAQALATSGSLLLDEPTPGLHPCTDCAKLNVGNYCAHYQSVMPWPEKPNACIHFEQRQPDTPWE
jgi:hypothetical protein